MILVLRDLEIRVEEFTLQLDLEIATAATGIFGPSGAGKTLTLETIAGLRRPLSGRITLAGHVLCDAALGSHVPARERHIGYVPQDVALFPHLTVKKNLRYGCRQHGREEEGRGTLTVDHVADVLEIDALLDRSVASLSGGEARRVAVARALLSSPRLLLLDEPLAGLDRGLRSRVLMYLRRVRDEFRVPMLYVTHEADEVVDLCDDVVLLDGGRQGSRGAPEVVLGRGARG